MTLKALQRQWDAWGRQDPLRAAVTRTDKLGGRWDLGEFMRSGQEEVDLVLAHLRDLGVTVDERRALDFGCGVGRYTQALAGRFERADGVDIAPSMLKEARRLNRHGGRCEYHLNAREDLALFADASRAAVLAASGDRSHRWAEESEPAAAEDPAAVQDRAAAQDPAPAQDPA